MSSGIYEAVKKLSEADNLYSRGANSGLIIMKLGEAKEAINIAILKFNKKRIQFDKDPNPLPLKHQITAIKIMEKDLGIPSTGRSDHEHLAALLDAKGVPEDQPHSIRTRMAIPNLDTITNFLPSISDINLYGSDLRRGSDYMDFEYSKPQALPQEHILRQEPNYTVEYDIIFNEKER